MAVLLTTISLFQPVLFLSFTIFQLLQTMLAVYGFNSEKMEKVICILCQTPLINYPGLEH